MKIKKIDHIGIVVADLTKAVKSYAQNLALPYLHEETNEAYHCKIAFLHCGEVLIELIEPTGEGPSKTFLDAHGEGLHHICYEVENIQEALTEAQEQGLTDYTEAAVGAGDSRVFFLKPSAVCGVETEFVQLKKQH